MFEHAICFKSESKQLIGIVHGCDNPSSTGVLIVVGGPQTRVGSHRQFVLLARYLAQHNIPVMRFDYAGMGDSDGKQANYLDVSADIDAAISEFKQQTSIQNVVIWGLCDAVSAALLFARQTPRQDIAGYVLLNPWVRSEQGEAKTVVKHYYLNRLKDKSFWMKLLSFKFNPLKSFSDLADNVKKMSATSHVRATNTPDQLETSTEDNYIEHMLKGLQRVTQPVLLIISGKDLTAAEFLELIKSSKPWKETVTRKVTQRVDIAEADHTFSSELLRNEVEKATLEWVKALV